MADFERLVDLAAERLGGAVVWATDDFFGPKENLLKAGRGESLPGKYTERGKWMDGWESRRRRDGGHDWCVIRLGLAGVIRGVDVDTGHFLGNAPRSISIDACRVAGYQPTAALVDCTPAAWTEILASTPVQPGSQNLFPIAGAGTSTHLRLHIFPDGGVARLRVYGEVAPDWDRLLAEHTVIDLAAVEHGGTVVAASDEFFSDKRNLILPGSPRDMGDGWETRRRRGPGHDWVVVKLGRPGSLHRVEVDTTHFKGNFPESFALEGCHAPWVGVTPEALTSRDVVWRDIHPRTKLEAHTRHTFELAAAGGPLTHVRMNIYPDGGVARLRLYGAPAGTG